MRPTQRGTTWLSAATPEQIDQALGAGELADLLVGRDVPNDAPPERPEQLASTEGMSQDEIANAASEGRLDDYLGARR